jgi:hypothetical protein
MKVFSGIIVKKESGNTSIKEVGVSNPLLLHFFSDEFDEVEPCLNVGEKVKVVNKRGKIILKKQKSWKINMLKLKKFFLKKF